MKSRRGCLGQSRTRGIEMPTVGRWKKHEGGGFTTPGGDPVWECSVCGGDTHVMGVETTHNWHRRCKDCGSINRYPWELTTRSGDETD